METNHEVFEVGDEVEMVRSIPELNLLEGERLIITDITPLYVSVNRPYKGRDMRLNRESLRKIEKVSVAAERMCNCSMNIIMSVGCQCGGK